MTQMAIPSVPAVATRVARADRSPRDPATTAARAADRPVGPPTRRVYWRRRAVVAGSFLALVLALTVAFGSAGAEAELADPVGGHTVVEPGETLWDIAVETAPAGVDVRDQLAAIVDLNGLDGGAVRAWTVVLLPAR